METLRGVERPFSHTTPTRHLGPSPNISTRRVQSTKWYLLDWLSVLQWLLFIVYSHMQVSSPRLVMQWPLTILSLYIVRP